MIFGNPEIMKCGFRKSSFWACRKSKFWKPEIPQILQFRFVKVEAFGRRAFVHPYLCIFLSFRILHSVMGPTDYNKNQCNGRHLLSRTCTHCINASTGEMEACCHFQWCTPCKHVPQHGKEDQNQLQSNLRVVSQQLTDTL